MKTYLETERLVLRRFTDSSDDAALVWELDSDPEVMRHIGPFGLPNVEAYREQVRSKWLPYYAAHPDRGFWAAHDRSSNEFVGWFHLRPSPDFRFAREVGWTRRSEVDVGYRLRKAAWGRGLATEAAAVLVRRAWTDPEVTSVMAIALVANRASTRVLEKCGLARRGEVVLPGFTEPAALYALGRPGP